MFYCETRKQSSSSMRVLLLAAIPKCMNVSRFFCWLLVNKGVKAEAFLRQSTVVRSATAEAVNHHHRSRSPSNPEQIIFPHSIAALLHRHCSLHPRVFARPSSKEAKWATSESMRSANSKHSPCPIISQLLCHICHFLAKWFSFEHFLALHSKNDRLRSTIPALATHTRVNARFCNSTVFVWGEIMDERGWS